VVVKPRPRPVRPTAAASTSGKPPTPKKISGGWEIVGGSARCPSCVKDDAKCLINTTAIGKWREELEQGVIRRRHPPHTSCKRCLEKKKG
jgi:hypothetical protein